MRLVSLELAGFRGFASEKKFDFDADAVVVIGSNGNGKTSMFDAILWAISGRVPRLGDQESDLVSKFADTGQARVVLQLKQNRNGKPIKISRVFDGKESTVSVDVDGRVSRGPAAEGHVIDLIWADAAAAAVPADAMALALTRSAYLQQDKVREFIDSATDQQRFAAVSELFGAGRVTDLQGALEKAKAAWSKATNSRRDELQPLRSRSSQIESRLSDLKGSGRAQSAGVGDGVWDLWWRQLKALDVTVSPVPVDSREAAGAIDAAVTHLDALRRAAERRQVLLDAVRKDLASVAAMPDQDTAPIAAKVGRLREQIRETQSQVSTEQGHAAEMRRLQAELKEKDQQLRSLAALALQHLGEKCPVCDQVYNAEKTRKRLEVVASGAGSSPRSPGALDVLPQLLSKLATQEKELASAESELRVVERAKVEHQNAEGLAAKRLVDLGIALSAAEDRNSKISEEAKAVVQRIEGLRAAQRLGEGFALQLSQAGNRATIKELEQEAQTTRQRIDTEEAELSRRAAAGDNAQKVIEALRHAASTVVTARIKEIEPLLSDMYSRIDAHPAFRAVGFLASIMRGKGQLATVVRDPVSAVESSSPERVLSSSQMNALAVCAFLSLNLGVAHPPLDAAILDDPLQSLDDINLLGLIDLLRRTKDQRQLFVSTHDVRFGDLLARKLRPRSSDQRTLVIELDAWNRQGPNVSTREVKCDPVPLRLIAS